VDSDPYQNFRTSCANILGRRRNHFDFIAVGTKWVEGCYCLPDAALKGALGSLTKNHRYVLIDSPAGLEHLNRRITSKVNDIFDIIDPSKKSFDHVERAYRVAK